jgi:predicted RNase H-like HicB family nuclease
MATTKKRTRTSAKQAGARYTAVYERDAASGWWVASVKEVPGCLTQGPSLGSTRERIREALGLFVDDAETAELVDDIRVPAKLRAAISRLRRARRAAEREAARAQEEARRVARELTDELSVRDAGELLGMSHQRVQQLVSEGA